tara:strand:+ start:1209 stop:1811 length:603 start_codon:yes stop_codon:yes gene_type:complete
MTIIAVTGGVAVGKSVMMAYWQANFTAPIFDMDDIGRAFLEQSSVKNEVVRILGNQILCSDGNIDRRYAQQLMFSDVEKKHAMESFLHPLIRNESQRMAENFLREYPFCVVVVPLLYETGTAGLYDRVCVVESALDQRIRRCFDRGMSETVTLSILQSQASSEQRLSISHDIIYNMKDFSSFYSQIDTIHARYEALFGRG